jgi:hypothetical protein
VFESALIVLSVLLGFAATEWRDRRETRARADQALAAVAVELDSNRALARRARLHQRAKADTIAAHRRRGEPLPPRVYFYGMFDPARVQSTAWEAARQGELVRALPYPLVLRLGRVYEYQAQYRALSDALIASFYEDMVRRSVAGAFAGNAESLEVLNRDFADRAGTLEAMYDGALAAVRAARRR